MIRTRRLLLVLLVGLAVFAAACGDDGVDLVPADDDETDTDETPSDDAGDIGDAGDPGDGDPGDSDQSGAPTPGDSRPGTLDGERSGELVGRWIVRTFAIPGAFTNPLDTDQDVFVEFAADGTLTYHTGCNQGSGTWVSEGEYYIPENAFDDLPEGQPLLLDDLSQTEIGCDGFLGDQDVEIPAALRATTRFAIADDGTPALFSDEVRQIEFEPAG